MADHGEIGVKGLTLNVTVPLSRRHKNRGGRLRAGAGYRPAEADEVLQAAQRVLDYVEMFRGTGSQTSVYAREVIKDDSDATCYEVAGLVRNKGIDLEATLDGKKYDDVRHTATLSFEMAR